MYIRAEIKFDQNLIVQNAIWFL